jgi:hypothetical protein
VEKTLISEGLGDDDLSSLCGLSSDLHARSGESTDSRSDSAAASGGDSDEYCNSDNPVILILQVIKLSLFKVDRSPSSFGRIEQQTDILIILEKADPFDGNS